MKSNEPWTRSVAVWLTLPAEFWAVHVYSPACPAAIESIDSRETRALILIVVIPICDDSSFP